MTITMQSSIENDPAVSAALGDLAKTQSTEEKPEVTAKENLEAKEGEAAEAAEPTEGSEVDDSVEASGESDEENETEELEASGEDSEEESKEEQKPAKKKGGFQKRIDKLSKQKAEIEREKEYWRQEALRAQASREQANKSESQAKPETKADPNSRPKAENFETHEAFIEALTDWKYDQRKMADAAKQKEEQVKTEYQKKISTHQERVQKFAEAHDDFNEVVNSVQVPLPLGVQQAIVESDLGPELMYALAKDQKELQRICSLSVLQAAKEIGKLESRLSPASQTSEKKTTKAPTPINPVRTKGSKVTKSPEQMSQREYELWRNEQIKARRQQA